MRDILGLTFSLTHACDVTCRHCGVDAAAGRQRLPTGRAGKLLEQALGRVDLGSISLTGGEPFLLYNEMLDLLGVAARHGLWAEVVSNSNWAVNQDIARRRLAQLAGLGVRKYVTSVDVYHAEHIPLARVALAVAAALENGMQVVLKLLAGSVDGIGPQQARDLLGLDPADTRISMVCGSLVRSGRARQLNVSAAAGLETLQGACSKIMAFPSLDPDGTLRPCCSFGSPARAVGHTDRDDIGGLLEGMRHDLLFNLIGHMGPAGVLQRLDCPLPAFAGPCEACNYVFDEPSIRPALQRLLHELSQATA